MDVRATEFVQLLTHRDGITTFRSLVLKFNKLGEIDNQTEKHKLPKLFISGKIIHAQLR